MCSYVRCCWIWIWIFLLIKILNKNHIQQKPKMSFCTTDEFDDIDESKQSLNDTSTWKWPFAHNDTTSKYTIVERHFSKVRIMTRNRRLASHYARAEHRTFTVEFKLKLKPNNGIQFNLWITCEHRLSSSKWIQFTPLICSAHCACMKTGPIFPQVGKIHLRSLLITTYTLRWPI